MSNLYQEFYNSYKRAYPSKKPEAVQKEVNELWNGLKKQCDKSNSKVDQIELKRLADVEIKKLSKKAALNKAGLTTYFAKVNVYFKMLIITSNFINYIFLNFRFLK